MNIGDKVKWVSENDPESTGMLGQVLEVGSDEMCMCLYDDGVSVWHDKSCVEVLELEASQ